MNRRYNPVTPISGKLPSSQSSMFGKIPDAGVVQPADQQELLKSLYVNIGSSLNQLLQNYSVGNILAVKSELDQNYSRLSINIRNNSKPDLVYYEVTRLLLSKVLDGMNQSIQQYLNYIEVVSKLEACTKYKDILEDPVKLTDYINQMNQQKYLFDVEPITVIKTMLKPQYSEYIRLYGFPEGGIFNAERLSDIVFKLENGLEVTSIKTII